jgi:hypothetical protein
VYRWLLHTSSQLGRLAQKFRQHNLIRASFILYALALFIVPFVAKRCVTINSSLQFLASGLGMWFSSIKYLLAELAPREYLATILSVNGTFSV